MLLSMLLDPMDPSTAYFLGLLQTDGCHEGHPSQKGRVTIELASRDEAVLVALAKAIPYKATLSRRTRVTNFSSGEYTTSTLRLFDQDLRRQLTALGIPPGKKSTTIGPPRVPFSAPDYLRGVLDGDGSVGFTAKKYPFISLVTASGTLSEFFCQQVAEVCGVVRTANRNSRDGVFNIMVTSHAAATLAHYVWYEAARVTIARKYVSAQRVATWKPDADKAGRYGVTRKAWTPDEDSVVLSNSDEVSAEILDRTIKSVAIRRWRLKNTAAGTCEV